MFSRFWPNLRVFWAGFEAFGKLLCAGALVLRAVERFIMLYTWVLRLLSDLSCYTHGFECFWAIFYEIEIAP